MYTAFAFALAGQEHGQELLYAQRQTARALALAVALICNVGSMVGTWKSPAERGVAVGRVHMMVMRTQSSILNTPPLSLSCFEVFTSKTHTRQHIRLSLTLTHALTPTRTPIS